MSYGLTTREEWLLDLSRLLRSRFNRLGAPLPERIRFSCGWPSSRGLASRSRVMGECWRAEASADSAVEIFVSPLLDDAVEVAEVLVHELVHAAGKRGHGREFAELARGLGLTGKMRSSVAGDELRAELERLTDLCGPYPHGRLEPGSRDGDSPAGEDTPKKQSTRMLKVVCPAKTCGYTVRTSRRWLDVGVPTCPCGTTMVAPEAEAEVPA